MPSHPRRQLGAPAGAVCYGRTGGRALKPVGPFQCGPLGPPILSPGPPIMFIMLSLNKNRPYHS
jgi:hypothetical protein